MRCFVQGIIGLHTRERPKMKGRLRRGLQGGLPLGKTNVFRNVC